MKIQATNYANPSFGIKIPIKDAVQAASARNLFGTNNSINIEKNVIRKLTNINDSQMDEANFGKSVYKLSKILQDNHPELKKAAEQIDNYCEKNYYTMTKDTLSAFVHAVIKSTGKDSIDIAPLPAYKLGIIV